MLQNQPIIGTLRVRTRRNDGAALRLAVESQLNAAALTARRIGPAAILLIRKLDDPLPYRLRADLLASGADREWQRALQARIDSFCERAARPAQGRVDTASDAVLFADEAELLACLAFDLGRPGGQTAWWRIAVARMLGYRHLRALCADRLQLLPAVFSLLAKWDVLHEVLAGITERESFDLCAALAAENGLTTVSRGLQAYRRLWPEPVASQAPPTDRTRDPELLAPDIGTEAVPDPQSPHEAASPAPGDRPPWMESWIPSNCRSLATGKQLLVALTLGARIAPAKVASRRFAVELTRWLIPKPKPQAKPQPQPQSKPAPAPHIILPPFHSPDISPSMEAGQAPDVTALHSQDRETPATTTEPSPELRQVDIRQPELQPEMIEEATEDPLFGLDGIETHFGGLFYLINVMEHLDLPGCFERPCRLASTTGSLGTLEAIARVFAGTLGEELQHDPAWAVLAKLDGRAPNSPPRTPGEFDPASPLPARWLQAPDTVLIRETETRTLETLRREGWPPALLDWLTRVVPYIGWRIAHACGLESIDEALGLLLDVPARIYVTESHIDVVVSIQSIHVPIRLAGLDRSPGWVRSMQRVVLFHFE